MHPVEVKDELYPRSRLIINNRIIYDCGDYIIPIENNVLQVTLKKEDSYPIKENEELIKLGGWKINVKSNIDIDANPDDIINGWGELNKLISMDKLFEYFYFSNIIDFLRLKGVQYGICPSWTRLLNLCYWYHLNYSNVTFHYKQKEIKNHLKKIIIKMEPIEERGWRDFFKYRHDLEVILDSIANELMFAALCSRIGFNSTFSKEHDFYVNDLPSEVKTIFSSVRISRTENDIPKIEVGGMPPEGNINIVDELKKFILCNKVKQQIDKAINQKARIIFLDVTHTFQGSMFAIFSIKHKEEYSFNNAMKSVFKTDLNHTIPVVVTAAFGGYEHQKVSFMLPLLFD